MRVPTRLMVLGLVDKMGEQDKNLKTLVCCLVKLGGHKMPWSKIRELPR